jgi:hypothetical protein
MEVVAELGVPLRYTVSHFRIQPRGEDLPYGASPGVPGSEGGGGRLIKVGALVVIVKASIVVVGVSFGLDAVVRRKVVLLVKAGASKWYWCFRNVGYDVVVQGSKNARAIMVTRGKSYMRQANLPVNNGQNEYL